jgi:hypothetical protein
LNLSFADSAIAFYDAKYAYQLWRPVTAIRLADTDGNPNTVADANWLPLARKHRGRPVLSRRAQHHQRRGRASARTILRRPPGLLGPAASSPASTHVSTTSPA